MRLLICTQRVDAADPVLGFFHQWLKVFAGEWAHIHVICLEEGEHQLPDNVSVYSLGKELGKSRAEYVSRFYRYVWQLRDEHDVVLVHMNPEYVLLGWFFWWISGQRIGLWYNHTSGNLFTRTAMLFSNIVFHTSPYAFTAQSRKAKQMPAGIDTEAFTPPEEENGRDTHAVLSLGRIAPVKRIDVLVRAACVLADRGVPFTLGIYGNALPANEAYERECREAAADVEAVTFYGSVSNAETPAIYGAHGVFVNLTPAGNYDKTVLEAMACGTLVVTSSRAFADIVPPDLLAAEGDAADLADKIQTAIQMEQKRREELSARFRHYVAEHHALDTLSASLRHAYNH